MIPRTINVTVPVCDGEGCKQGRKPKLCDCKPAPDPDTDTTLGAAGAPLPGISLRSFVIGYALLIAALVTLAVKTW